MRTQLIVLGFAILAASGCATVTRGTSEDLIVRTVPEGATVTVSGTSSGNQVCAATPCTFRLPRRSDVSVLVQKDGYKSVRATVRGRLAGFVPLGPIGAAVDVASGAALKLQPNPLVINLELGVGEILFVPPEPSSAKPQS